MRHSEHLKVAIDAQITPGVTGGVAQATLGLINALRQLIDGPEEYYVIVQSQKQSNWLKPFIGTNQQLIVKPQSPGYSMADLTKRALRPLARFIRKSMSMRSQHWPEVSVSNGFYESLGCDVLHFPHQGFILCAMPTIYNPHDLQHSHYPQFFTTSQLACRETVYSAGCRFSRTVVVASQWVKDDIMRQYQISPDKLQVIPWGAPTQIYSEPSKESLSITKAKYHLNQPFAFFPAVTWPHKNHIRLLEAIAHLRDDQGLAIHLVCTGSLYEPFWPSIKNRIDELKLWPQVKFLGFVPEEDLRLIYQLSQLLIMPTLFESDSFPIYEAWLEGTPVVCSNVTSLPDQVMDAALLFDPNHVESIANAIAKVTMEVELRRELRKRGYLRLKDFDWERTGKAYRAVYRRVAGRPLNDEDRWILRWDWMLEPKREKGVYS